jgi:hypothetical protein
LANSFIDPDWKFHAGSAPALHETEISSSVSSSGFVCVSARAIVQQYVISLSFQGRLKTYGRDIGAMAISRIPQNTGRELWQNVSKSIASRFISLLPIYSGTMPVRRVLMKAGMNKKNLIIAVTLILQAHVHVVHIPDP